MKMVFILKIVFLSLIFVAGCSQNGVKPDSGMNIVEFYIRFDTMEGAQVSKIYVAGQFNEWLGGSTNHMGEPIFSMMNATNYPEWEMKKVGDNSYSLRAELTNGEYLYEFHYRTRSGLINYLVPESRYWGGVLEFGPFEGYGYLDWDYSGHIVKDNYRYLRLRMPFKEQANDSVKRFIVPIPK